MKLNLSSTEVDAFLELRKWSDIYLITRDKMEESATNQRLEPNFLAEFLRIEPHIFWQVCMKPYILNKIIAHDPFEC